MASQSPPLSNINGVSKKKSSTSPTKGQALPPGWERLKSDQGAYYYWNKKTGKTSWKFPEEEGMYVCTCAWLLLAYLCNWIGTISAWTAGLTNDLRVQLRCMVSWIGGREREISYNLYQENIYTLVCAGSHCIRCIILDDIILLTQQLCPHLCMAAVLCVVTAGLGSMCIMPLHVLYCAYCTVVKRQRCEQLRKRNHYLLVLLWLDPLRKVGTNFMSI